MFTRTVTRVHDGKSCISSPRTACRGVLEVASAISSVKWLGNLRRM
jgi:hypothetical protein